LPTDIRASFTDQTVAQLYDYYSLLLKKNTQPVSWENNCAFPACLRSGSG